MKIMLCRVWDSTQRVPDNQQTDLRRSGSSRQPCRSCRRRGVVLVVLVVLAVLSPGVLSPGPIMLQRTKRVEFNPEDEHQHLHGNTEVTAHLVPVVVVGRVVRLHVGHWICCDCRAIVGTLPFGIWLQRAERRKPADHQKSELKGLGFKNREAVPHSSHPFSAFLFAESLSLCNLCCSSYAATSLKKHQERLH